MPALSSVLSLVSSLNLKVRACDFRFSKKLHGLQSQIELFLENASIDASIDNEQIC